jgi:hypothetical protein
MILAVNHNPCYWMNNKPRITSDFSKLHWTPKFPDNQRITDTYIRVCIFVCIFLHICVHSFRRCYARFGAYTNHTHIKIFVKQKTTSGKKTAQIGTNVRARVFLLLDCWLEVSLQGLRAPYMKKKQSNCQTKKIKIWSWVSQGARHQDELAD